MRSIAVLLLCLTTLNGHAQEQDFEMKQLFVEDGLVASDTTDFENNSIFRCICENDPIADVSPVFFGLEQESEVINRKALKFETHAVGVVYSGGYAFHVADYSDGTRVVTCLDGGMKGCQVFYLNGAQSADSYNVTWYKNYFLHKYPTGKVYSYPNKQVIKID